MADPASLTFMGVMGILMMASMIISPGIQAQVNISKLKEEINKANANYDDLKTKWDNVLQKQSEINQDVKNDIVNTFNNINDSILKANTSHNIIKDQCKQIQYIGILFILFIFILLLLKHFDLFDTLFSIISYPFTFYKKNI